MPSTSREQLTVEAQGVPDDPIPLPSSYLSCLSCGVAVPTPFDDAEVVRAKCYGRAGDNEWQPPSAQNRAVEISFTRCPDCARRDELARRVAISTEGLSHRFPVDGVASRLSCALDGLAALGQGPNPIANPNPTEVSKTEALRLIHHLGDAGRGCSVGGPAGAVPGS